jgi:hypothetical protein
MPLSRFFRRQAKLGREFLDHNRVRVNFGVLSIAQPGQTRPCGEILRFAGFFAVFLEDRFLPGQEIIYSLWYVLVIYTRYCASRETLTAVIRGQ